MAGFSRTLILVAICLAIFPSPTSAQTEVASNENPHKLEIASSAEAWERMPIAPEIGGQELPGWVRALVTSLPETTATMIALEYLHRVDSPLDQVTRSKLRWAVAHANRCKASMAIALYDMDQAGVAESEIELLVDDFASEFPAEQNAIELARQLSLNGSAVTDQLVKTLIDDYGEDDVVAMVLMIAQANFHDRLLHALGLAETDDSVMAPIAFRTQRDESDDKYSAPERESVEASDETTDDSRVANVETSWKDKGFNDLQGELTAQRERVSRIHVPTFEEIAEKQGLDPSARPPTKVRWTLVCMGYQPELASAWFRCMGTFHREADQDRVFEESVFWVVTRSIDCFY